MPKLSPVAAKIAWMYFIPFTVFPAAPAFSTLVTFAVPHTDGALVDGPLIMDASGALFGTTEAGGKNGFGTVFMLTPPQVSGGSWQSTTLYSFAGGQDGANPKSGVIFSSEGNLYGSTITGGVRTGGVCAKGCGTVFELRHPVTPGGKWTEKVLYTFQGEADGAFPYAGLVFGNGHQLFGTTYESSGTNALCNLYGCGTVFKLSPPETGGANWTETVIHNFSGGADGANPRASLSVGVDGSLYGTTSLGGAGYGTVFQLAPPSMTGGRAETILHTFAGPSAGDGAEPDGTLLIGADGTLYGTTATGGDPLALAGIAFSLAPPAGNGGTWAETIIHTFGVVDGARPSGPLTLAQNGSLYGTTAKGGTDRIGTVYELMPSGGETWTEIVLHSLSADEGSFATGGVLAGPSGVIYGETNRGPNQSYGAVFELATDPNRGEQ